MPGNIRLYGTTGYVELAAPATGSNTVLTLPTDSIQPGMVLVNKTDFSGAATVSVNNCFTTAYQNYRIIVNAANSTGSSYDLNMRGRSNGIDNSGAIYYDWYGYGTTTWSVGRTNAATFLRTGVTGNAGNNSTVRIDVMVTIPGQLSVASQSTGYDGSGMFGSITSALTGGSNSFDGFTIYSYSGNISGTLRVYGYRNS